MARSSGANSRMLGGIAVSYGAMTAAILLQLPFSSANFGGDQALIDDNLLGRGRNPQDPTLDIVTDTGDAQVPVDARNFWFWLYLMMGAPTTNAVKAKNTLTFTGQPAANATLNLNGTTWTFVAGSPTGNQIQIGANLAATLTAAATALNASAETQTTKCDYTAGATTLDIEFSTTGVAGNAFTVTAGATLNATIPDRTLIGGGYAHVFTSGALSLPDAVIELGFPEVPSYGRNGGMQVNTMRIPLQAQGLLDATVNLIGQKETTFAESLDDTPTLMNTTRFSQFSGEILRNGVRLAGITGGEFSYNNNFDPVRTIRPDGAIDGVDLGINQATPSITARFSDSVLLDQAQAQVPCDLSYGWKTPDGFKLTIHHPRVFLPRPKRQVSGPGGISVTFPGISSYDQTAGYVCRITLINDRPASDYVS